VHGNALRTPGARAGAAGARGHRARTCGASHRAARGREAGRDAGGRQGATGSTPGGRAGRAEVGRARAPSGATGSAAGGRGAAPPGPRGERRRPHEGELSHPGFKGQSRVHLIHASKKTTYIITECIEINVTV
jgi:hypothetical protein